MASTFRNIRGDGVLIVPTVASLPVSAATGLMAVDASTTDIYVFDGVVWQLKSASGSAGVTSFNTRTGIVVSVSGDYNASQITNTPAGGISATDLQAAINELDTDKIGNGIASNNQLIYQNGSGVIEGLPGFSKDTTSGGLQMQLTEQPNANVASYTVSSNNITLEPLQNSPDESWNVIINQVTIDPTSTGFTLGTNGTAARTLLNKIFHNGTSDTGAIELIQNNFSLGNGTDPIDIKGVSYLMGFGQFNANVNISGPIQGYGFQTNINAAATMSSTTYTQAFYDAANFATAVPNYSSFNASPTISSIVNNNYYNGLNINPTITNFTGNAGANAVAIGGNWGSFGTGGWNGININPNITLAKYAAGINVSMDNVIAYAGVQSTLTEQDLTFTWNLVGDNNAYTMEYTPGATAGAEVVSILGNAIEVQIENGVSTANQIKTALEANMGFNSNVTVTVSGVGTDPQVTFGPTNFINGENAGNVKAAQFNGDVEITGALSFSGALSIGKLTAFASQALTDGGGTPSSIHSLITNPTVAANATLTSADSISVNTAALINIGDNAVVGTSFIGVAALGLPAVLTMGTGSTVDRIYGALFALSLDAGATGGTADEVGLCKAVAIPNGVTTVNNLYGYLFDLPFGDPGTKTFGFYDRPGKNNYLAGQLLIGGTAGSDDLVTNSSVALEIKSTTKAFINARMTTTERNALTAVNGMQIYNTTDDKLQVYAGGSWVDLH